MEEAMSHMINSYDFDMRLEKASRAVENKMKEHLKDYQL